MKTMTRTLHTTTLLLGLAACLLMSTVHAQRSLSGEAPILEKTDVSSKLRNPDMTPNLRVFASGRVEVYRPVYMKNSGLFEGQVDEAVLAEVREMVVALRQFDPVEAETLYVQANQAEQRATGTLRYVSETRWTHYTFGGDTNREVVVVEDAQMKAERFPNLYAWTLMSQIDKTLKSLETSVELTRLENARPVD